MFGFRERVFMVFYTSGRIDKTDRFVIGSVLWACILSAMREKV